MDIKQSILGGGDFGCCRKFLLTVCFNVVFKCLILCLILSRKMSIYQSTAEVANRSVNKSAKPDHLANARETKTLCGWTQLEWPYEGSFYELVSELDEMIFASQIRVSKNGKHPSM